MKKRFSWHNICLFKSKNSAEIELYNVICRIQMVDTSSECVRVMAFSCGIGYSGLHSLGKTLSGIS